MAARWCKENGMKDEDVRAVAEGRMVRWNELADLEDGTIVKVMGNLSGGMGKKKSKKKKEKNPWESDVDRECHLGHKRSLGQMMGRGQRVVRRRNNLKNWTRKKFMEDHWEATGSAHIDVLAGMDPKEVEEKLMRCRENMKGVSEDQKTMAVWSLMWMVKRKKEEQLERIKEEAESRAREGEKGKGEAVLEKLMDERSQKREDRKRLEREKETESWKCWTDTRKRSRNWRSGRGPTRDGKSGKIDRDWKGWGMK